MSEHLAPVLVVDDDRANLESLERIFRREGVDVSTAADGKKALEVLRKHPVSAGATAIGVVSSARPGLVELDTGFGSSRLLDMEI